MELHLDMIQEKILREFLDAAWRDLCYEIADTDSSTYKHGLRERAAVLRSILDQLGMRPAATPS